MQFKNQSFVILTLVTTAFISSSAEAARWRKTNLELPEFPNPKKSGTVQAGASPYVTGIQGRPRYYEPPTIPRTPTWKMYGTEPGVAPGDWPRYAPFGFGGYRFPAVGNAAYR